VLLGHQGSGGSDFRFPIRTISKGDGHDKAIHAPTLFQAFPNWYWHYEDFLYDALDATEIGISLYDHSPSGSPTLGLVANGTGGQLQLLATNTNEAQTLALMMDDNLFIQGNLPFFFAARVKTVHTMAANQKVIVGLGSALKNDPVAPDLITRNLWFLQAATTDLLVEWDDGTTDRDDKDTGADITAGAWYWYIIERAPNGAIYFGLLNASGYLKTWTPQEKFGLADPSFGANNLQPIVAVHKASGTTTPQILVDAMLFGGQRA
jgi:hypothetical protein